jgi:hypothetical protein
MVARTGAAMLLCVTSLWAFDLTYGSYATFLESYVCPEGVAYSEIAGDPQVAAVGAEFASLSAEAFSKLSTEDQIAFLVNAYNFHTIALVSKHYPLKSGIRDIGKPWDLKFIRLFGETVSLNHIEHDLLRSNYSEPRVHFALNCASRSCPVLPDRPFVGSALETQLAKAAKAFLADTTRNRVDGDKLMLSQIFQWYGGDFSDRYGSYQEFVMGVLGLTGKYRVKFLEYDWSLNGVSPCRGR